MKGWLAVLLVSALATTSLGQSETKGTVKERFEEQWAKHEKEEQGNKLLWGSIGLSFSFSNDDFQEGYGIWLGVEYRGWLPLVPYGCFHGSLTKGSGKLLPREQLNVGGGEVGGLLRFKTGRFRPFVGVGLGGLSVFKDLGRADPYDLGPYDERTRTETSGFGSAVALFTHLGAALSLDKGKAELFVDLGYRLARPKITVHFFEFPSMRRWIERREYKLDAITITIGVRAAP